ncbi:hypothetical protein P6F28_11310 [Roseicyclus marinus]|uniref:hypothetical protein n=1 Tax=Roseicyclus marinus TaxID=2161673 RepID=UPI0024E1625E|nr:hypothetical protein [Roseicyclus marinus]MDG3041866.1 hypothetical protein [Roseicyclus marinus]
MVEHAPERLEPPKLGRLDWVSPIPATQYREYQDYAFLDILGLGHLDTALREFWPRGGAVWDGLAQSKSGPVLVEAKAHVSESFSSPCGATAPASLELIRKSLSDCSRDLGADMRSDWARCHYQTANRIAHLWWLHRQGIRAHLLFVHFVGDAEMKGPKSAETWIAVEMAANYALGLPKQHGLSDFIHYVHTDVSNIG